LKFNPWVAFFEGESVRFFAYLFSVRPSRHTSLLKKFAPNFTNKTGGWGSQKSSAFFNLGKQNYKQGRKGPT
jgi:hypothetical protein